MPSTPVIITPSVPTSPSYTENCSPLPPSQAVPVSVQPETAFPSGVVLGSPVFSACPADDQVIVLASSNTNNQPSTAASTTKKSSQTVQELQIALSKPSLKASGDLYGHRKPSAKHKKVISHL